MIAVVSAKDLKTRPSTHSGQSTTPSAKILAASERDWALARRRAAALKRLLDAQREHGAQVQRIARQLKVTTRTIYRWLFRFRAVPQPSTLLSEKPGVKRSARQLQDDVESIISSSIEDIYLTRERARFEDVYQEVRQRCIRKTLRTPSRKAIIARIRALDPNEAVQRRHGPHAARTKRPVPGRFQVNTPLDVLQVDHTLADIMVVDEVHRKSIGRPWISLAVDVATRAILGFHLSLDPPSSTSVALCLAQACLPKDAWLEDRALQLDWPMWGLPRRLHLDNAAEFRSKVLERGCAEYGITIDFRPPATPHYGGHVERLIGTLMGRVHLLPGTTRSHPMDKDCYPSEDKACMTLSELERWLALEICGSYHAKWHRSAGASPLAAWRNALKNGFAPPLPAAQARFVIDFLPFAWRQLRRDGLHLFHIRYWDAVLPLIFRLDDKVMVRYNPRDLSRIYVLDAKGRYHGIPYSDLRHAAISLWENRAAAAQLRAEHQRHINELALFDKIEQQRALVARSAEKTKEARRQQQRQKQAVASLPKSVSPSPVDYSEPPVIVDGEIWE